MPSISRVRVSTATLSVAGSYAFLKKRIGLEHLPPDALQEIGRKAIDRGTGARALRSLFESVMLDLMYDLPSNKKVRECVVTRDVVRDREKPVTLIEKAG